MSSLFSNYTPLPTPTGTGIYSELISDFRQMLLMDPIMKAMWDGTMRWGDIPGIIDYSNEKSSRRSSIASESSEDEYDLLRICSKPTGTSKPTDTSSSSRVTKPVTKSDTPQVPAFEFGRLTLIARNLPRDIKIQQLRYAFEKYGPIKDIYIPKNMDKISPYFGTIKGFALIKFLNPEHSAKAYQSEYGKLTIGRNNVAIEFAKYDQDDTERSEPVENGWKPDQKSSEPFEKGYKPEPAKVAQLNTFKPKEQTYRTQKSYDTKKWFYNTDGELVDKNGMPYGF
jgi:hypothetical protein